MYCFGSMDFTRDFTDSSSHLKGNKRTGSKAEKHSCFQSTKPEMLLLALLMLICLENLSFADFLIVPPLNATVLMSESGLQNTSIDQVVVLQKPTFAGSFYGQARKTIYVSENGSINFPNNVSNNPNFLLPTRMDSSTIQAKFDSGLIAPFWDDVLLVTGNSNAVLDHSVSGDFLAITWRNVRLAFDSPSGSEAVETPRSFQAVWFERNMNFRGFDFMKDDLAFSYVAHQTNDPKFGDIAATIGVADGGNRYTALPPSVPDDDTGGYIENAGTNRLALADNSFLLFRPQYDPMTSVVTGYISSLEFVSAVPEPSAVLICGFAMIVMLLVKVSRRSA